MPPPHPETVLEAVQRLGGTHPEPVLRAHLRQAGVPPDAPYAEWCAMVDRALTLLPQAGATPEHPVIKPQTHIDVLPRVNSRDSQERRSTP